MITVVAFVVVLATVPLFGGRLSLLARIRPARGWAIAASVALQVVLFSSLGTGIPAGIAGPLHLLSYGFALIFVHANWRLPGMIPLVSGGLLNLAAIAANGGVMPASIDAMTTAGLLPEGEEFRNSNFVEDAKLAFLGDIFAIPEAIPFANVYSIGDVVLVIGGAILVHSASGSQLRRSKTNLALANGTYPAVDALLSDLANNGLEMATPAKVELVDATHVTVTGPRRKPVLVIGIRLLPAITVDELRALGTRASIRRAFGASEAFDLAHEHEIEATKNAASATTARDLAFGLMVQASMQSPHNGAAAVLDRVAHPVEPAGPTLAEHLEAMGIAPPRTVDAVAEVFGQRVRGQSAALLLTAAPDSATASTNGAITSAG